MTSPASSDRCFSATRALCNVCGELTDAKIVFRDHRVFLVKWCLRHGATEALVCSDVDWYLRSTGYVKPATPSRARSVAGFTGCPTSCGLCPEHGQHTCLPILEVTRKCDLNCPICLVRGCSVPDLTVPEVHAILDQLVRCEGTLNMLTLSGGEPTAHPDFLAILDACRRPEVGLVSVSTNGLAIARDLDLARAIRDRDAIVSLQYDGQNPATYAALRGRGDLAQDKARVLESLLQLGVRVSLTMTLAPGINESELENALGLLLDHDLVVSLMIQPLARTGALYNPAPHADHAVLTAPDVVSLLVQASRGTLVPSDFTPLPCSHPSCFTLTYLLKTQGHGLVPLPRVLDGDIYLDAIRNQALLNTDYETLQRVKHSLYELWSTSGIVPHRDAVLASVKQLLMDLNRLGRTHSHREVLEVGVAKIKSIFIHHFMDRATFDLGRAAKCCNHYPQPDGRLIPACVRNNLAPYRA